MYKYWILVPLATLLLLELGLRLFWVNPYLLYGGFDQPFRLHEPGLVFYARVDDDLYPGVHRIRFAVDQGRAISGGAKRHGEPRRAMALGGSTTESGLVPEGRRWPDLLHTPAYNFGVAGNSSLDSYHNLKYLLEAGAVDVEDVLIMHAVNDLRSFLAGRMTDIDAWSPEPLANVLGTADQADQPILFGIRVKDSALLSFIRYQSNNLQGRSYYPSYLRQRKAQDGLPELGDEAFGGLMQKVQRELLPRRREIYARIAELARGGKVRLLLLTQPHAYDERFRPHRADLRLFPVYQNHKLNVSQAAGVLDTLNRQTRQLARDLGSRLIDVDACFSGGDLGGWFYDSVHYTPAGSAKLAECVDGGLQ